MNATANATLAALLLQQSELAATIAAAKETAIADARASIDSILAERATAVAALASIDSNLAAARANLAVLLPPVINGPRPRKTSSPAAANAATNPNRDAILAALASGPKTAKELGIVIGATEGSGITDYHCKTLVDSGKAVKLERGVYALAPATDSAQPTA